MDFPFPWRDAKPCVSPIMNLNYRDISCNITITLVATMVTFFSFLPDKRRM